MTIHIWLYGQNLLLLLIKNHSSYLICLLHLMYINSLITIFLKLRHLPLLWALFQFQVIIFQFHAPNTYKIIYGSLNPNYSNVEMKSRLNKSTPHWLWLHLVQLKSSTHLQAFFYLDGIVGGFIITSRTRIKGHNSPIYKLWRWISVYLY